MNPIHPDSALGYGCRQGDIDRAAGQEIQRMYRGFTILIWPLRGTCCTASWGRRGAAHWLGFYARPEQAFDEAREAIDRRLDAAQETQE
jgi:hypothetical protein